MHEVLLSLYVKYNKNNCSNTYSVELLHKQLEYKIIYLFLTFLYINMKLMTFGHLECPCCNILVYFLYLLGDLADFHQLSLP